LSGERRRYLAQQRELGGDEALLSPGYRPALAKSEPRVAIEPSAEAVPELTPNADRAAEPRVPEESSPQPHERYEAASPSSTDSPMPKSSAKWKKGAPAIPGAGLTVVHTDSPLLEELQAVKTLEKLHEVIRTRTCGCTLCANATNVVPGEGNPHARLVLVGEGPGATEDALGRPFVGKAGELLNEILSAIELPRESVYITNVVKCRPPQNRKPLPDEIAACLPFLFRQLQLIRPKVIVAMGGTAAEALLGVKKSLGELRGKVHRLDGIPLVVTYHPAALLRNPNWKKPTWDDVRIARQLLDG
jgi:DNA polymerase